MSKPGLHRASCQMCLSMLCEENQFIKESIKDLVRQGVIVSSSLIKSTMDQVECDEVLLGASQLYETTSTCEGQEETNVSDDTL